RHRRAEVLPRLHASRCSDCRAVAERSCAEDRIMAVTVYPVTPSSAAEIGDIDLAAQIEPANLRVIKDALAQYAVLIFPDQRLSQDQHLDFARHFGPLETSIAVYRKDARTASARRICGCFQQGEPTSAVPIEQPALAHRQLVTAAVARLVALCAFDP